MAGVLLQDFHFVISDCSRVNNSPTTLPAKAGAEPRSDTLGKTASLETGNLDVRIPVTIPADGRAGKPEEKNTASAGNPDIKVKKKRRTNRRRRGRRRGCRGARSRKGRACRKRRKRGGRRPRPWGEAAV
ncbi:hypothetical protein NDU88_007643 [Pleurodeles waltl]|uniref:Uncharacterized protein n=1 Tax=Pleurodeles waltl TaxID=8319 RepID=A0AAV7QQD4_PLEWA|nr:hypothetical protein NDU88_007643 [Pleurodeles waltl]